MMIILIILVVGENAMTIMWTIQAHGENRTKRTSMSSAIGDNWSYIGLVICTNKT